MIESIGGGWGDVLARRLAQRDRLALETFLAGAWAPDAEPVYPSREHVFAAFDATPLDLVRAVILGQDPYPTEGQACGLAFSVPRILPPGVPRPQSLGRILAELRRQGFHAPNGATLEPWTGPGGVLLLNATLTFAEGADHRQTWRPFTTAVIGMLVERSDPIAFLLWGKQAQGWSPCIRSPHITVFAPHPMAWGKAGRFAGSGPFRTANSALGEARRIDWCLGRCEESPWPLSNATGGETR